MMNTKISSFLWILVLSTAFWGWSCSSTKISVESSNPAVKLSDYKTFDFVELEAEGDTSSAFNESINDIKSEVIRQMNVRGLTQQTANPQLKINLGIVVEEKTQTRQTSLSDPGEWTYIGQRNYKWESKTVKVGTYKEGSITLHLIDSPSNEAVWIGSIEGVLPRNQRTGRKPYGTPLIPYLRKLTSKKGNRFAPGQTYPQFVVV